VIIIDENVDQWIIDQLVKQEVDVFSIRQHKAGISDREVIKIAASKKGILLTEDKDFDELVFSHNLKNCLLRYDKSDVQQVIRSIVMILERQLHDPGHNFYTISKGKVRSRKM
jgi:predicted nuclease of predicted toxin-antitoxin system